MCQAFIRRFEKCLIIMSDSNSMNELKDKWKIVIDKPSCGYHLYNLMWKLKGKIHWNRWFTISIKSLETQQILMSVCCQIVFQIFYTNRNDFWLVPRTTKTADWPVFWNYWKEGGELLIHMILRKKFLSCLSPIHLILIWYSHTKLHQ